MLIWRRLENAVTKGLKWQRSKNHHEGLKIKRGETRGEAENKKREKKDEGDRTKESSVRHRMQVIPVIGCSVGIHPPVSFPAHTLLTDMRFLYLSYMYIGACFIRTWSVVTFALSRLCNLLRFGSCILLSYSAEQWTARFTVVKTFALKILVKHKNLN